MSSISDKEFYHLTISINKALNLMEAPLKIKHARSAIITTHRTKETKSFWAIVTRQPLMENRFTAWKFCHLLHKVLREGHTSALKHSQSHKKMIHEMGKLWGHLQDGLGQCIQSYSKLIVTKLEFHEKNAIFTGSLMIDFREIEKYAGDDINVYFQICVELFDYLDDIIDVQTKIFASINAYRMSSMTPQGQCRLAPLITLIQDSNPLYDLCVRVMFKLHDELPNDILAGHRDRFRELFSKLKYFYDNVRPLQYFANLIQVPQLPESAPNFTSKVDFGSYIPPVVVVQPDPEPALDNLVDTSNEDDQSTQISTSTLSYELMDLENTIRDRDDEIQVLRNELITIKDAYSSIQNKSNNDFKQLQNDLVAISNELLSSNEMNKQLSMANDAVKFKFANESSMIQKITEEEEKVKISEEKFNKLKVMYTQIRDEHITLLRQQSDSTKLFNKEKQDHEDLKSEMQKLKAQLAQLEEDRKTKEIACVRNKELEKQIDNITHTFNLLQKDNDELKQELYTIKSVENPKLTDKLLQLEKDVAELEICKSEIIFLKKSLSETQKEKDDNSILTNSIKKDLDMIMEEKNTLKIVLDKEIDIKNDKINELKNHIFLTEEKLKETILSASRLTEANIIKDEELQDLLQQNCDLDIQLKAALSNMKIISTSNNENEVKHRKDIISLLKCVLNAVAFISLTNLNEPNQHFEKICMVIKNMEKNLDEHSKMLKNYCENNYFVEDLVRESIFLGCNYKMLYEHCIIIFNTSTDIEKGQDIYDKIHAVTDPILELFQLCHNTGEINNTIRNNKANCCYTTIKHNLAEIKKLMDQLMISNSSNVELGDLVENELEEMDKVIREAAEKIVEMLSNARSKDIGVKLEVNEKILDACTTLMEYIKILIKKSKFLQEEIVSAGRGNISVKEFYKRNSQWTEGLISASKSVAKGANLLVEAANKAVTSESNKNFEIIVAAQEIAACTAQLVIASKVKAPKESTKLLDLTKASRNVSQATGAVVATVKDCNQHLEQSLEIDLTKLTSSQCKTMEMEIHVKVLELEQALQLERLKLASFRRSHYQNTED